MAGNKLSGDTGELEVVDLVPCPNCNKKLMVLPPNYPLFDVQCTGCSFRAQVKTNNSKPKNIIFGAGWDIMEKVLKSGFITPPLIVNFKWAEKDGEKQEIRFYPFVPKTNLEKYRLSEQARRANYMMFRYVGLDKLPHFVVYSVKQSNQDRSKKFDQKSVDFLLKESDYFLALSNLSSPSHLTPK